MRSLVVIALLAAAAPAAAQGLNAADQAVLQDLRMQQEAAQRRAIDQANQLEAASARLRAEAATLDLQLQRGDVGPRRAPALRYELPPAAAPASPGKYPSMPDAALADSNKKVQDAARNRR
jgi:type II secretory pathway pseudopilin PulG